MVESEVGEVPVGWAVFQICEICEITSSKRIFENEYTKAGIPFYRGKEITLKKLGEEISDPVYISKKRYKELVSANGIPEPGDILMTAVGTIGSTYMVKNEEFYFKDGNVIWFKKFKRYGLNYFIYDFMQSEKFISIINEITIGSTQNAITIKTFGEQKIVLPEDSILTKYLSISKKLNNNLAMFKDFNIQVFGLQHLLLSKLATLEN